MLANIKINTFRPVNGSSSGLQQR